MDINITSGWVAAIICLVLAYVVVRDYFVIKRLRRQGIVDRSEAMRLREVNEVLRDGRKSMVEFTMELNSRIISLTQQLEVAMKMNQRDNEFTERTDPFPETNVMPLEGIITPYQRPQ